MVAELRGPANGRLGLLIADDDLACRSVLREVFEPEGLRTYEAASGPEAIEIVRVEPIHVLLLDWQMPMMTGLEAFRIIKDLMGPLPCIFMTGRPSKEVLLRALAEEAFTVIEKPISAGVAVFAVRRVIEMFYA